MLGVVLASQDDGPASVVAARTWTAVTGDPVVVLVDHPDLVAPVTALHGGGDVRSWAQAGTDPGATGALLAAVLDGTAPGTTVVVLPAGALVLAAPDALASAAGEYGVAVARRGHASAVPVDDLRPTGADVAAAGAWHPSLLALRAGDERATAFLAWWDEVPSASRDGVLAAREDRFAPVDDPGTGVGWWNLHERPLTWDGGRLLAAGVPACVVDLGGWRPDHGHLLHPDMTRLLASGDPALRRLVATYAGHRAAAGEPQRPLSTWPEDPPLVELLAQAPGRLRTPALRDDPGAREAFLAWVAETDREDTVWGISRYLLALRRHRHDLQLAFPDLDDRADAARYLDWARRDGPAAGVDARFVAHVAELEDPVPDALLGARGAAAGVNVIGLFGEPALGIAEIARQVRRGLEGAGVPVTPVTVDRRGRPSPGDGDGPLPHRVTIACVNADLLPVVARRLARRLPDDGALVGVWWWELQQVPGSWDPAIALVDEIWAGTRFVAEAFAARTDVPVRTVPLGLTALEPPSAAPDVVAADDRPYVLVSFDYASRIERKNPDGAIEAFRRADLGPGVRLVVKSVNGDLWPREAELVRLAAQDAGEDRVLLLDEPLSAGAQAALVAGAAAHLALHRSEGLGLTIVEALMRGVPVIATDHGGSTDLLTPATGWPVPFAPGRVPPGCDPYPAGAAWAEPDLDAAAGALREVLAGGPAVDERVAAGRRAADERAARIAAGTDLAAAARDALAAHPGRRRGLPDAASPKRSARAIVRRLRG